MAASKCAVVFRTEDYWLRRRRLLSCTICNARIGVFTAQCTACRTRFTWWERSHRFAQFVALWIAACMGWGVIGSFAALAIAGQPPSIETQAAVFIGALVLGSLTAHVLVRWLSYETVEKLDEG